MSVFILFTFISIINNCHPECAWSCDDPVCPATCKPICNEYNCSRCFINPDTNETYSCEKIYVGCAISCPSDQCEDSSCPVCALSCNPNLCNGEPNCIVLCQELECNWACSKPLDCPYPKCILQCDQPACGSTSFAYHHTYTLFLFSIFMLTTLINI